MYQRIAFKKFSDGRGDLVPIEFGQKDNPTEVPFDVKRCYYISAPTNDAVRGKHAHYDLEQVIICIHGSFTLVLDDGSERKEIFLDNNHTGIHIKSPIWRELKGFMCYAMLSDEHFKKYQQTQKLPPFSEFKSGNNKVLLYDIKENI